MLKQLASWHRNVRFSRVLLSLSTAPHKMTRTLPTASAALPPPPSAAARRPPATALLPPEPRERCGRPPPTRRGGRPPRGRLPQANAAAARRRRRAFPRDGPGPPPPGAARASPGAGVLAGARRPRCAKDASSPPLFPTALADRPAPPPPLPPPGPGPPWRPRSVAARREADRRPSTGPRPPTAHTRRLPPRARTLVLATAGLASRLAL